MGLASQSRLFTPAKYNGLPGLPFPGDRLAFPTKDQQADYLEDYAARFHLAVRPSTAVTRLTHDGQRFHVTAGAQRWTAANVVLATGACHLPKTPGFAADLPSDVVQLHSHTCRNPAQLKPGPVLLVGAGNSGAEIALETSRSHDT
ncbi:NAD(P)-binding domain-containing protein [Arthrobacter ipis]|uniref:NAD(P)-binding domain-containing protein n=1 Tax=Arthrobacter ipis TaxID=2716202 RepID=UPI00288A1F65|nr:NAD(P)-binding domain-containing protein [Arthrobacter ipis]